VGKSSLLNALTLEQRAIVSHIPGTTRDIIEEIISINGLPVRIIDSAGIRQSHDEVEQEGIRRSLEKLALADLVLYMVDGSQLIDSQDRDLLAAISGKRFITVITKNDLPAQINVNELPDDAPYVYISSKEGKGLVQLRSAIFDSFIGEQFTSQDHVAITTIRQRDIVVRAINHLDAFLCQVALSTSGELLAIDIRDCLAAIGEITGETTTDDILDIIFSSFCIGK
jgi:tRNA modification GTPase